MGSRSSKRVAVTRIPLSDQDVYLSVRNLAAKYAIPFGTASDVRRRGWWAGEEPKPQVGAKNLSPLRLVTDHRIRQARIPLTQEELDLGPAELQRIYSLGRSYSVNSHRRGYWVAKHPSEQEPRDIRIVKTEKPKYPRVGAKDFSPSWIDIEREAWRKSEQIKALAERLRDIEAATEGHWAELKLTANRGAPSREV